MAESAEKAKSILELRGIYKDFDGLEVLFDIHLGIQAGERHAIIGPNGAGKSTLLNLITGKFKPSKGDIFFKGQDITGASNPSVKGGGSQEVFATW